MATYRDALDPMPELGLTGSAYDPSRIVSPTLPGSIEAMQSPLHAAVSAPAPQAQAPVPQTPPPATPGTPPPVTQPPATPAPQYSAAGEAQLSNLIDELDKTYGIKLGADWRDTFQKDPNGFVQYLTQIAANPGQYGNRSKYGLQYGPGELDAWLARVKAAVSSGVGGPTPQQLADQRNQIFQEAQNRLEQGTAASGRAGEEELLSALASRGLLDSGIGARELGSYRTSQAQNVSNALSQLNQQLLSSGLDVSSQEYLDRLLSGLNLQNQMALLQEQGKIQKQNTPSPWWSIGGTALGALPFLLSARTPNDGGSYVPGPTETPGVTPPALRPREPMDPYGLGR